MLIRLEHGGAIVYEVHSADIKEDITIGRSKKCTWSVPQDDAVISGQHASLSVKGKAVIFTDLQSKNGSYYHGKRIARRTLVREASGRRKQNDQATRHDHYWGNP